MAESAAEAARGADAVITMLPDGPEVERVLFEAADELAEGALAIDMSTIAPTTSRSIGERLRERGIGFLDAPVTGSRPKAEDATLTIMVGGDEGDFERARPLLESMGRLVVHVGPSGHGEMVKLDQQHAGRRERRGARRAARAGAEQPTSILTSCARSSPRGRVRRRCSSSRRDR